jgi:hypothetical protein
MNKQNVVYPCNGITFYNKSKLLIHDKSQMSLENMMLSERSQVQENK